MLSKIYTIGEVDSCARLFASIFTDAPWHYEWVTDTKAVRYFRDFFNTPGFLGFIFTDGDTNENVPLGFCIGCVSDYFSKAQYDIKEIMVDTRRQRQGIGSQMLSAIEGYLSQNGVACVTLLTDRRIPAFDFYIKNGYACSEENVHMFKLIETSHS